jgi:hypothetical protein
MSALHRILAAPRHRGQTIVLFALMSLVLMAGLGLVIDAGVNYAQRRNMQNAADTAALAGARVIARQSSPFDSGVILATNRNAVWNAVFETAKKNGAPNDPAQFQCEYIDNARAMIGTSCKVSDAGVDGLLSIPNFASGVQVRVSEEHTTFFMRAIGVQTSGTAAISMAQVQVLKEFALNDVLFMVCGLETKTTAGTKVSILTYDEVDDWDNPNPSASPKPPPREQATEPEATIRNEAYTYDWNQRTSTGALDPLPGSRPTFVIYGSTITNCGISNAGWKGLILPGEDNEVITMSPKGDKTKYIPFMERKMGDLPSGTGASAGPARPINGTRGCPSAQNPDGECIMILPIADNSRRQAGNNFLLGRAWGAFMVTKEGDEFHGKLIRNYPLHGGGENAWDKTYNGPVTVTLVKIDP